LAGDDDGSADPYFKFTFHDSVKVSSVKESTINPVYIERMILEGFMGK
jgi:Ca2+-dependent lipid-binding protein